MPRGWYRSGWWAAARQCPGEGTAAAHWTMRPEVRWLLTPRGDRVKA